MASLIKRYCYLTVFVMVYFVPSLSFPCVPRYFDPVRFFSPAKGAKDVPITTEMWIQYKVGEGYPMRFLKDILLRDAKGKKVPIMVTSMAQADFKLDSEAGYMITVKPVKLLQPHTKYELLTRFLKVNCDKPDPEKLCATDSYHVSSTFTTGNKKDTTPPDFRGFRALYLGGHRRSGPADCGRFHYLPFLIEWFKAKDKDSPILLRYTMYAVNHPKKPVYTTLSRRGGERFATRRVSGAEDCDGRSDEAGYKIPENPSGYFMIASDLSGNHSKRSGIVKIPKRCGLNVEYPAVAEPQFLYERVEEGQSDGGNATIDTIPEKAPEKKISQEKSIPEEPSQQREEDTDISYQVSGCSQCNQANSTSLLFSTCVLFFLFFLFIKRR